MRWWIILASFVFTAWPAAAQTRQYVVLDSVRMDGARYLPGATLGPGERIDVPTGSRIVLLSASGEVLRIDGPDSRQLAAVASVRPQWLERLRQLAAMISVEQPRQTTVSGARSTVQEAIRPIWAIDPRSSGVKCVSRAGMPMIWLPRIGGVRSLKIEHLPSGTAALVQMAEDVTLAPWPNSIPLADGSDYRVTIGRTATRSITVAIVDATSSVGEATLVAAGRSCDEVSRLVAEILRTGPK
jgi:hypothetical protein